MITNRASKVLEVNLSNEAYNKLEKLARKSGRSIDTIVRHGLALVKLVLEEQESQNKLVIVSSGGKAIREIDLVD